MADRAAFAERIRLQLQARYSGSRIEVDAPRHALHVRAPGVDVSLPLATLEHACERQPQRASTLIAEFVRSVESQLVPRPQQSLSLGRLVWCVRGRRYIESLGRSDELLSQSLAPDIVAFVAEALPGALMRGVPRVDWEAAGADEDALRVAADQNTAARFARLLERIAATERVPSDGWRMAGDPLFQGSILMVPAVLRALVDRCGGEVLIGVPDRALALVVPAASAGVERFGQRVLREWREAMNPCSRTVLRSDGASVAPLERVRRPAALMPWLSD